MEELNSYALSDLELDASKAVIHRLETEFGHRAGDHLTRSLSRFLESEVQDPIKAFTITCWIHSKGLTLSALCSPDLAQEISARTKQFSAGKRIVSNGCRKANHVRRIEHILTRGLLSVFTRWSSNTVSPLSLSVGTLSAIEHTIAVAPHQLDVDSLCQRLNEAVNGTGPTATLGQKPLKKHFDALATEYSLGTAQLCKENIEKINPRLRRALKRKACFWNDADDTREVERGRGLERDRSYEPDTSSSSHLPFDDDEGSVSDSLQNPPDDDEEALRPFSPDIPNSPQDRSHVIGPLTPSSISESATRLSADEATGYLNEDSLGDQSLSLNSDSNSQSVSQGLDPVGRCDLGKETSHSFASILMLMSEGRSPSQSMSIPDTSNLRAALTQFVGEAQRKTTAQASLLSEAWKDFLWRSSAHDTAVQELILVTASPAPARPPSGPPTLDDLDAFVENARAGEDRLSNAMANVTSTKRERELARCRYTGLKKDDEKARLLLLRSRDLLSGLDEE
ncbi:MAG: hypothetical protein Q9202_004808 [Teloschistes flavicans]